MADIPKPPGLDWVKLEKDMNKVHIVETHGQRILRKCKENPLVPIGASVTVGALMYGIFNLYKGDSRMQQNMMRLRVAAQFFTVVAALGGVFLSLPPEKRNLTEFLKTGDPEERLKALHAAQSISDVKNK